MRISENQIIFGINYMNVKAPGGRIVWVKGEQGSPFSMAEIAYQSFYFRVDSHLGSGSSAIAANNMGFEFVGCELDQDYYNAACKRIAEHAQQERLFA